MLVKEQYHEIVCYCYSTDYSSPILSPLYLSTQLKTNVEQKENT